MNKALRIIGILSVFCVSLVFVSSAFSETWKAGDVGYCVVKNTSTNECIIGTIHINKITGGVVNITEIDEKGNEGNTYNISLNHLNSAFVKWHSQALKQKKACEARK